MAHDFDPQCPYCLDNAVLDELMLKIVDLKFCKVYLFREQSYRGRCIVAANGHKTEIFEFTDVEQIGFTRELSAVARAIFELCRPVKINYAVYGDGRPHYHVHVVPKYKDAPGFGGPFELFPSPARSLTTAEYGALIEDLRARIAKILAG